jgi:hypothetical protein
MLLKIELWRTRGWIGIPGFSGGVDVGGEFPYPAFAVCCTRDVRRKSYDEFNIMSAFELILSNKINLAHDMSKLAAITLRRTTASLKYSVSRIRLLIPPSGGGTLC